MTTWPSGNKTTTANVDSSRDSISATRTDIEKMINNQNDIIDIFNIPATPTDNYMLIWNASTSKFDVEPSMLGKHDIWIPAQAMYPTADGGCSPITTVELTEGAPELRVLDFSNSTTQYAQFSIAMPKSWNEGTITFTAYWTGASVALTGGVSWGLQAVGVSDDDAIDSTFGSAVVIDDEYIQNDDLHITSESSALTVGGTPQAGDLTFFQLYRDTADSNDTYAAAVRLVGVKIHYTIDVGNDD
jgi:hypothetical protein